MIYLSAEYIISAIEQLAPVHAFLGITFLTCKKNSLPVGEETLYAMDQETRSYMESVHRICPMSNSFYQPFTTIKDKHWVVEKYPSAGLQSLNTRTFKSAFLHEKNSKYWGWATDYVDQIARIAVTNDQKKLPLPAIAVWVLKYRKWKDTASIEDVVSTFIAEFHITDYEKRALFSYSNQFPPVPAFQAERATWNQLSDSLSPPPDARPDEEGTLSRIELSNVGPCDHIEMDLSTRLNIITGDNGLGKTFLLDCAWWALTNTWPNAPARPKYPEGSKRAYINYSIAGKNKLPRSKKVLYDNKLLTWKRGEDTDTIPGLIIYALVDGSYAVWDPSKGVSQSAESCVFTRKQVWDGESSRIEGLIRDWVKWQNTPEKYPFEVFTRVLEALSPPDLGSLVPGETVRIPNDSREIPTIVYPYGVVPVTNSSAGVGRIITLAYLIVWAWNEHKENCKLRGVQPDSRIVVMVDELEAHLHPKWQRTILPALINVQNFLADELEVQFIIATHSPLVMASIETMFSVDTDKLFQIKLNTDNVDAILTEESFIKYGQVNSWLTSPIFNLGQARSMEAENAINEAKRVQLQDEPDDAAIQAIHEKLLLSLSQNDPFWPRWVYFAEQHGVKI